MMGQIEEAVIGAKARAFHVHAIVLIGLILAIVVGLIFLTNHVNKHLECLKGLQQLLLTRDDRKSMGGMKLESAPFAKVVDGSSQSPLCQTSLPLHQ